MEERRLLTIDIAETAGKVIKIAEEIGKKNAESHLR